tara:strand:- start:19 stop:519 length:501 start_codon:yes stop_codon:yes gene_type:complete
MKLILILLLISPTLFAQKKITDALQYHVPFNTLIMGNWKLTDVEVVDGFNVVSDTNRFKSQKKRNNNITITADSIYSQRDTTLRFYVRNQNFSYKIQYDSIMCSNYLKLYAGERRKLREVESYEIIKCAIDELVLKSYQFFDNGLDLTSISIVYTFRKNGVSTDQF